MPYLAAQHYGFFPRTYVLPGELGTLNRENLPGSGPFIAKPVAAARGVGPVSDGWIAVSACEMQAKVGKNVHGRARGLGIDINAGCGSSWVLLEGRPTRA